MKKIRSIEERRRKEEEGSREEKGRTQECPRRGAFSRDYQRAVRCAAPALTNGFVNRGRFKVITQRKKAS